jgi:hypothetical protein
MSIRGQERTEGPYTAIEQQGLIRLHRGNALSLRGRGHVCSLGRSLGRSQAGALAVLAGPATDGDVAKRSAFGPVATTVLAEMARLREVVVVVVAEFGVGGVAPGTLQRLPLISLDALVWFLIFGLELLHGF